MPAFTIMAHALAQELAARGIELTIDECEEILAKVVDRVAVAGERPAPTAKPGTRGPTR